MLMKISRKTFSKNGISRQWENVIHNVQLLPSFQSGQCILHDYVNWCMYGCICVYMLHLRIYHAQKDEFMCVDCQPCTNIGYMDCEIGKIIN